VASYTNIPTFGSSSWVAPTNTQVNLPASGNNLGDTSMVTDTSIVYTWNGTAWVPIGSGSSGPTILALYSSATHGGAAREAVVVTGLLATDTILSVSQKTMGTADLPLEGWDTQVTGGITVIYLGDMGPGAIVLVAVKR
jgi:hypothetical protein